MDIADKPEFARLMATLGEVYEKRITQAKTAAYFDTLQGFPIGVVKQAARKAVLESKWFPTPADLRETCRYYTGLARQAERETMLALAPPATATDDDRCPDCGATVAEHRAEFRGLVAMIGTPRARRTPEPVR